jgi:hypothetical protein
VKWIQFFKAHRMTKRKGPFTGPPKVRPIGHEDELDLPSPIKQDLAFCRAMVKAGYKLVELDEVRT